MQFTKSRVRVCIAAALAALCGLVSHAVAQTSGPHTPINVAAGTVVQVEVTTPLSSENNTRGDAVSLRLIAPIVVDGQVVVAAGAEGAGELLDAANATGTRPGKLVVAGRHLTIAGRDVPLRGMQFIIAGEVSRQIIGTGDGGNTVSMRGAAIVAPAHSLFTSAQLAEDIQVDAPSAAAASPQLANSRVEPLPTGAARVVFFRQPTMEAVLHSFNVRDGAEDIGRLASGSQFVYEATPGVHEFNVGSLRDTLRFEVEPGATYYVRGIQTIGLISGRAVLVPSDQTTFDLHFGRAARR